MGQKEKDIFFMHKHFNDSLINLGKQLTEKEHPASDGCKYFAMHHNTVFYRKQEFVTARIYECEEQCIEI